VRAWERLGVVAPDDTASKEDSSRSEPGWVTVALIVALLIIIALPRSITSAGFLWGILGAGTALVLWKSANR
jgi:hypothetical protein